MAWKWPVGLSLFLSCSLALLGQSEIMPLSEVRVGQQGEWKTVVEGNRLVTFRLEVLGVVDNFVGPKAPVIICKALDEEHIISGPVAGMSGSPVYIDGRLVGAYAYGYSWPKQQSLIGVTPIAQMLSVLDLEKNRQQREDEASKTVAQGWPSEGKSVRPAMSWQGKTLPASPTSLMLGGFSTDTLAVFAEALRDLGVEAHQAGLASSKEEIDAVLEPGYPLAAVYMQGDFDASGVGTITWRSGDQLLAFGHAMALAGDISMPVAGAEIITIVQGVQSSFKLSQVGPVVGTLRQDRLTAVLADLSEKPTMLPFSCRLINDGKLMETYQAQLFRDANLTPLLSAMALLQVMSNTVYTGQKVSTEVTAQIHFDDGRVIPLRYASANRNSSGGELAVYFYEKLQPLWDNVFEGSRVSAIDFEIDVQPGTRWLALEKAWLSQTKVRPGESVAVTAHLRQFQEESVALRFDVVVPPELAGEKVRLLIADASAANEVVQRGTLWDSYEDIRKSLADLRSNDALYAIWVRQSDGLSVAGHRLQGVPPSVLDLMKSPRSAESLLSLRESVVGQVRVPVEGIFSGSHSFMIEVESW